MTSTAQWRSTRSASFATPPRVNTGRAMEITLPGGVGASRRGKHSRHQDFPTAIEALAYDLDGDSDGLRTEFLGEKAAFFVRVASRRRGGVDDVAALLKGAALPAASAAVTVNERASGDRRGWRQSLVGRLCSVQIPSGTLDLNEKFVCVDPRGTIFG
jgi:hypothetical protein